VATKSYKLLEHPFKRTISRKATYKVESSETRGKTYDNYLLSYDGIVQPLKRVRTNRQFLSYFPIVFFNTLIYCYNIFKQLILRDNSLFYSRLPKLGNISNFSTLNSRDKNNSNLNPWFVTGFVDFLLLHKLILVKSQLVMCTYSGYCHFIRYNSNCCITYLATKRNSQFKISTKQIYLSQIRFFHPAGGAATSEFSVQSPSRLIAGLSSDNKSLVVWGKNLTSTVGEKFTLNELKMVKLAPYQQSVIIPCAGKNPSAARWAATLGLLLSDGWLIFGGARSKNVRLGFKQSADRASYILFVFNILSHYCSSGIKLTTGNRSGKRVYGLEFFTRSMPCLTELYYFFYVHPSTQVQGPQGLDRREVWKKYRWIFMSY
jgi:LAGLIDADG DNA endonuclease family